MSVFRNLFAVAFFVGLAPAAVLGQSSDQQIDARTRESLSEEGVPGNSAAVAKQIHLVSSKGFDYAPAIKKLRAAVRYEVAGKDLPAFSISVVDRNEMVWADGFGFQDAKKKIPATAETVYPVGSISKLFSDIAAVGSVLENQVKVSDRQRVRQSIFAPLGMKNSSFVVTPEVAPRLATGWMWTYDDRRFEAPTFPPGTGPAGNLYSNVIDLSKFLSCLFNNGRTESGRIFKPGAVAEMISPRKDANGNSVGQGLGLRIQDLDGHARIGHRGAVDGFSALIEALPERELGVAAASALDASNGVVSRLANYALRLMLATQDGKTLPEYGRTVAIPPERIPDLLGTYREVDGKRFTQISELNGRVMMRRGSFRHDLRARADDGSIMTDDVIGSGTQVKREGENRLSVGALHFERLPNEPPKEIPGRWRGLIGEYGWDHNTLYILEDNGELYALIQWLDYYPLKEVSENVFEFPDDGLHHGEGLKFTRTSDGIATEVNVAEVIFQRREVGTKDGETFKISPVKPIDELRAGALAANPPSEPGDFRDANLAELVQLDPTIKLDIRYATTNNFTGAVFYEQPKAFMQQPAAEAVVRANARLSNRGLGLLIHDAYRPWQVTKMFWDATPSGLKDFVANPATGSRHNRGCAVDLTLYDLTTGKPIPMVAGYDEFSPRSFAMYPGGTSRQRWYRELLRETMEAEGFTVYEFEWWHFDFKDWKKYRIGNVTFEEIGKQ